LTETAAPTVTIKLPESYKDIADAVICSENTRTPTHTYNTEVKHTHTSADSNHTTVKNTHAPSTPTPTPTVSSLFTIPTTMESGDTPKILCRILGRTFPILLDTGAGVSVLPLKMAKYFQPPVDVSGPARLVPSGPTKLLSAGLRFCPFRLLELKFHTTFFY